MRWMVLVAVVFAAGEAVACGPDSDCPIGARHYRIAVPDGEGPYGAVVFMHGYQGTAAGVMDNAAMRAMADRLGVALIAPKSGGPGWRIRNAPRQGDVDEGPELAFFDAMLEDAAARHPIDRSQLLATGFSEGGMMTWTLACHRADAFAAFLPIAGTFWAPIPERCPGGAVDVVHINGTADAIVPLEGRPIADTHQGNVRGVLDMFAADEGYAAPQSVDMAAMGLDCDGWATQDGEVLALCLHDGGHTLQPEWIEWAWRTFVERPAG